MKFLFLIEATICEYSITVKLGQLPGPSKEIGSNDFINQFP